MQKRHGLFRVRYKNAKIHVKTWLTNYFKLLQRLSSTKLDAFKKLLINVTKIVRRKPTYDNGKLNSLTNIHILSTTIRHTRLKTNYTKGVNFFENG